MERTNLVCRHGLQYHKKRLTKITHNGFDYTFAYDGFGNRKSVPIAGKAAVSHDYEAKNGNLLKSTYANGWEVAYTYDNLDRVTEVKASKDGTSYTIGRYIYDKLGRVARFIDGQVSGKSCTYGYDLTDRLCEAVFDDGTAYRYTYDANDCLIKEVQTTPDGVRTVTRGYDADSRETSVACGSAKIEKTFDKLGRLSSIRRNGGKHTTAYTYETASDGGQTGRIKTVKNGSGQLMAIRYKGADYYYIRNGLMTITGLVDANGAAIVNYRYDSWGMLTGISGSMAGTLGKDNPYRFKGYYYDEETGMYYLKSRYYQPEICRFISADTIEVLDCQGDLNDKNLYAYCDNNPVMRVDTGGQIWITLGIMAAGGGIGMVIGAASSAITQYMFNGEINWKSVGVAAVGGFVSGAVAASPLGLTGQIGVGAAVGAVSYVADCKVNGSALKVDELAVSAAAGAVSGWIGGSGANQYKALSNTIKTASKTTARFTRLISTKGSASLAAKRIAEAKMWRDTVLKGTTWISSIKFAAGTGTSNVIAQLWTKAKNKVRSWFK